MKPTTINAAAHDWLGMVGASRQRKTFETYRCAWKYFARVLIHEGIHPSGDISTLNESYFALLIEATHVDLSIASEQLYISAIRGFYEFLSAEELLVVNTSRIKQYIATRTRRLKVKLPEFPESEIEAVLEWVYRKMPMDSKPGRERIRNLRDRAFILTLADTGLRGGEACRLKCGDIDYVNKRARVVGKNGDEAVVRFSKRSIGSIQLYLKERSQFYNPMMEIAQQPVFSRHDLAAGMKLYAMTTNTGRMILSDAIRESLSDGMISTFTPHKLRHYFVTMIWKDSKDLKITQESARHKKIEMTMRYTHFNDAELDRAHNKALKGK